MNFTIASGEKVPFDFSFSFIDYYGNTLTDLTYFNVSKPSMNISIRATERESNFSYFK